MEVDCKPSIIPKLGPCEVCAANEAKYTCPKCEVKTCSIQCVRIHKTELECDGNRDRTLYKPLNKFTNLDLLSDYRLLEDIQKTVTKYKKDVNKRYTRHNTELPIQLHKLRGAAYNRGVTLQYLPQNFSKHKENTTYYDWKTRDLYWRIKWVFFGSTSEVTYVDERVLDKEKLGKIVSKYLSPSEQNPELEFYYSAGHSGVTLLLKADKIPNKFYELEMDASLRENLRKKVIIEYPTIYVVLKHIKDEFDIQESDEEDNSEDKKSEDDVQIIDED